MHYYSHDIKLLRSSASHLTASQRDAYRQALDWYYDAESPLPDDVCALARRLQVDPDDLRIVLDDFFTMRDGSWHNAHCDREIAKYHANATRNRANRSKGGRPRRAALSDDKPY